MGTLTLTELKEELRASLANRVDLDSRLTRFLNLAQERLSRMHDFDEMEVIYRTDGLPFTDNARNDKYITLPSLRELYTFKIKLGQRSRRLRQITERMWNRYVPQPEEYARGEPQYYTIWNNTCIIWPIANTATIPAEIWYTRWPVPFDDALPNKTSDYLQKDEVLLELALVYAYKSLGKQEEAQKHWASARILLTEAINMDARKPDLDILPSIGDTEVSSDVLPHEFWNDPFSKGSP